jgi:hypothetical protein
MTCLVYVCVQMSRRPVGNFRLVALLPFLAVAAAGQPMLFRRPAEEEPHERTWMAFPSSTAIWG